MTKGQKAYAGNVFAAMRKAMKAAGGPPVTPRDAQTIRIGVEIGTFEDLECDSLEEEFTRVARALKVRGFCCSPRAVVNNIGRSFDQFDRNGKQARPLQEYSPKQDGFVFDGA
jgi:hypothetical protein